MPICDCVCCAGLHKTTDGYSCAMCVVFYMAICVDVLHCLNLHFHDCLQMWLELNFVFVMSTLGARITSRCRVGARVGAGSRYLRIIFHKKTLKKQVWDKD